MLLLGQAPGPAGGGGGGGAALSATKHKPIKFVHRNPPLFFNATTRPKFLSKKRQPTQPFTLTLAKADGGIDSTSAPKQPFSNSNQPTSTTTPVFVGQEDVPLEGVIQFEKSPSSSSSSSRLDKWGRVGLLAGGDVLALLLFSAIGRFSHGFSVFDFETLRTADPFVAGWFLGAYFLGGYGEDGRGMNGRSKAVVAAAKSWVLGIPLGLIIRAASSGHIPPYAFILVTMGSTCVLLIGWRAIFCSILSNDESKKNDEYRRGSPFELFELLTSLVRRW